MIELRHRPFGWGHPYENDADERVPRKPIVGQSIELRCVSHPAGSLEKVWWEWWTSANENKQISAELVSDLDGESDHWLSKLPHQNQTTTLTYQLWGETRDGQIIEGGEFTIDIANWVSPDQIVEIQTGDNLKILYGFDILTQDILFDYWLDADTNLMIDYRTAASKESPEHSQMFLQLITVEGHTQIWENGKFHVFINTDTMTLLFQKDDKVLLEEERPFELLLSPNKEIMALRRFYKCKNDEVYLGLGERFNTLNQRGQTLDTRVFDQYRKQGEKTYIPVPFYLNSRGYGWFQNSSCEAQFYFPEDATLPLVITQETGVEFVGQTVVFTDNNLEGIVRRFTQFVALPTLPPVWTFGLWMSSNEWYTQAEVNRQVGLMKEHQIPATVLVIEAWSDEENYYIWNDAEYEPIDPSRCFTLEDFTFPVKGKWFDPKGLTDYLHNEGLKLILWQIPVLKHLFPQDVEMYRLNPQHDLDESYMIEKGFCVHNLDGSPYRIPPIWFSESLVLDVTNQEAVNWWLSKRQYLLDDIGVDGFKTDGGEHLWGEDLQFSTGQTNTELWNEFPKRYSQLYYDFANRYRNGDAVTFSRAGFTGSQSAPCHWAGDQDSTWDSFRAVLLAGQNLGISGVSFWGWDIAGFSGPIPSAELYLRSAAAATFAPIMQYHSEHNHHKPVSVDRTPWNIQEQTGDTRVISIFRKFANLRMNLLPYLYSEAVFSSQTGQPVFGCPFVRFQDLTCLNYPYQFLCGRHLLVAPVVDPGIDEWQVYLPEGRWVDFWNGMVLEGGHIITVTAALESIPVFVHEGAIIILNLNGDLQFGSEMSNRLDRYNVLAAIQFGKTDGDKQYEWTDHITKQKFIMNNNTDLTDILNPLRPVCNKIVSLRK